MLITHTHLPVGVLGMENAQKGLLNFDSYPNGWFVNFVPLPPHTQLQLAPKNSVAAPWWPHTLLSLDKMEQ